MASQVMRITLKAYDHQLIDSSAAKIVDTVKKAGAKVSGPVPLPTKKEIVTILRAVHKYKDSREQFEQRTHKRLIDVFEPNQKLVDALSRLDVPAGVEIKINMKNKEETNLARSLGLWIERKLLFKPSRMTGGFRSAVD